jgi:hypothetical protein
VLNCPCGAAAEEGHRLEDASKVVADLDSLGETATVRELMRQEPSASLQSQGRR